ncbi:hypothetical protein KM043_006260 [Ampulex compressa]|nr:hypothetical protein KM043_006260 [Ampulex compressa]
MTTTRTVYGFSRLLVLVPVTVCATISYLNEDSRRCNDRSPPPQTLARCKYDADCMSNAYCWNQEACLCKENYIVYRNRTHVQCLKVATQIGDPCKADIQCRVTFAPHSECRENKCQCSDGSHFEEGRCYESVELGSICQTHHNCYVKDTYCVSGYCVCTLQHHPNPRNTGCIRSAYLRSECTSDHECVAENSRCTGTCGCKVDHVLSSNGEECIKAANFIGEPCIENAQCQLFMPNTECNRDGICVCVPEFHQRGTDCVKDVALGYHCGSHQECITETYKDSNSSRVMNVDCIDGTCTCAEDYTTTENERDCIRYSDNGSSGWQACGFLLIMLANFLII